MELYRNKFVYFTNLQFMKGDILQGLSILDVNEETGEKAVQMFKDEFNDTNIIFIKADVSNKKEFDGKWCYSERL